MFGFILKFRKNLRDEFMMEHLSPESRQKVIKMSEARLRQKLVQTGYREVDVAKFDRNKTEHMLSQSIRP